MDDNSDALEASAHRLLDEYGLRILQSLRQIIHAIDTHSRKLQQNFQITSPQLMCLYCLERSGPMTLSRLAKEVSLGASTTTGIIDRLEAKGFVTRTRSQEDRRKVDLALTQAGRDLTRAAPSLLQDRFAEALRQLPELEQAAITLSLERVVDLMGAGRSDAAPPLATDDNSPRTAEEEPERRI